MESESFLQLRRNFVNEVLKVSGISNKKVLEAFLTVPREEFLEAKYRLRAYVDIPLPIGEGQTISQPSLVALMTQELNLTGGEKVLEIGTGSGYQAAILAQLAKKIYTIERIETLSVKAELICKHLGYANINFVVGDGTLGLPEFQPYDAIIVTAGAKKIPQPLLDQLTTGGKLVIPVGEDYWNQKLKIITKEKSGLKVVEAEPVAFVPLIGKNGWEES